MQGIVSLGLRACKPDRLKRNSRHYAPFFLYSRHVPAKLLQDQRTLKRRIREDRITLDSM